MREWKPGDVVTATVNGRPNVRLIAGWSKYPPQLRWCEMSPRWGDGDDDDCWFFPQQVTDHRPLVVIDPEDRGQVERLVKAFFGNEYDFEHNADMNAAGVMQAALRSLVEPPRPAEPTGLGAVVEDADGERWVRYARVAIADMHWRHEGRNGNHRFSKWRGIAAVKVLSEGVTP